MRLGSVLTGWVQLAYARAAGEILAWCDARGMASITEVQPLHVAAWIEQLGREVSALTVKQRLAGVRHLFDGS